MPRSLSPAATTATTAVILAATALALWSMGRSLVCDCEAVRLWTGDTWGPENSQQLADPYVFTHVTHGFLFYLLLAPLRGRLGVSARFILAIALESGWEVFENTDMVIERYRTATLAIGYYGDTVLNSFGDILACAAGFALAARLPVRASIATAVALELVLAAWIRDGLLLNVVMLVAPSDALRSWQMQLQRPG